MIVLRVFICTQLNHLTSLAQWLCVPSGTKWLWVRILLRSLSYVTFTELTLNWIGMGWCKFSWRYNSTLGNTIRFEGAVNLIPLFFFVTKFLFRHYILHYFCHKIISDSKRRRANQLSTVPARNKFTVSTVSLLK